MLEQIANTVRVLAAEAVEKANSGHPGLPLGAAEIGSILFAETLRHDPADPRWPNRDRFVLSAGHGSMLLYALLHLSGYPLPMEEIERFRQLGSMTPGHPEYGRTAGVETTTGPLGQGLGNAVGMALAERMLAERFNRPGFPVVDHLTYCLAGDGDMMEGVASEAASLAGHLGLGRVIVLYDANRISIEGSTELAFSEDVAARFRAYGWHVQAVDGYDLEGLRGALAAARAEEGRPSLIVARTRIARRSLLEGDAEAHGAPLGSEAVARLKADLGWPEEPFHVPGAVRAFFERRRAEWAAARRTWQELFDRWSAAFPDLRRAWDEATGLVLPADLPERLPRFEPGGKPVATRSAGGKVLQALAEALPYLAGGSADLAPSTKTYLEACEAVGPGAYGGRNLHFGVREHGMGAVLNGMALHGGWRVFGSTFLVFSDYMRPSIRLAALMGLPVVYVFTHDSIWVGEDGPTHQPVEQLEALRLIPNLAVIRPADARETSEAWLEALGRGTGPTALILSRQNLPILPVPDAPATLVGRGGYVVRREPEGTAPDLVLVATGSEVALALEAAGRLAGEGLACRVVSMPWRERFVEQPEAYQGAVLPEEAPRLFLEAGVGQGWWRLARRGDGFVTQDGFGESGPGGQVAAHFGFSADRVTAEARALVKRARSRR
ncbi:transketolase [Limnochorda pilosa]|uniref:Transketolase n=1 Tax=Limnochorda pilosa TaxID=1555112 RepID=A0A0K2SFZ5_LIMPI|nr:transketolase [Limnochorda pilosa]